MLSGSDPGSLRVYPKQLAIIEAARTLPPIQAPAALLADDDSSRLLLGLNADQARPMASTTKMMTALLVLEQSFLDELVVVSPNALVGESTMGLAAGEVLTVEDLLWGLLLNSGNDAAVALAEHVAGSEAAFVSLMNQRAVELGLRNTNFVNSHGMDAAGHYSTASDLWQLATVAMGFPVFRNMVATRTHVAAGHSLWNRNLLLGMVPGADGIKTGTTDLAGECLVGSVSRDGHRLIVVVLGSRDRYGDTVALLEHYTRYYRWSPAPQPAGRVAWVRGQDGRALRVTVAARPELFLESWQWPLLRTQFVPSRLAQGESSSAGTVVWFLGKTRLAEAPAQLSLY